MSDLSNSLSMIAKAAEEGLFSMSLEAIEDIREAAAVVCAAQSFYAAGILVNDRGLPALEAFHQAQKDLYHVMEQMQ